MVPIPSVRHWRTTICALTSVLYLLFAAAATAGEADIKVGFLTGGPEGHPFWTEMHRFAGAVAEDLNIDLQVQYLPPRTGGDVSRAFVDTLNKGDYLVTVYMIDITRELLQTAEERNVRTLLVNSDVLENERADVGAPREKFQHWIGHMQPDDVQAGYRVADGLLAHFDRPQAVNMIAINGDDHVQADADRQAGLRQRMSEAPGATLHAVETGNWRKDKAFEVTAELLKEYPDTNAVWTASDPMTLGAAEAVRAAGKKPGTDVVLAGVDWSGEGLAAVRSGEMLASVGGHFMEAGIALMLIYDYHHGRDFAGDPGVRFKTPMYALDRYSIGEYYEKTGGNPDWSTIDFRRFTKTHNPDQEEYDFSWQRISEQL